jgi:hypothetical protein
MRRRALLGSLGPILGLLWAILGLLLAAPSSAFPWPSPWQSTVPDHLTMVGRNGSGPDTSFPFTVVVRNSDGGTMAYLHVTLEFSSDYRICSDQGPGFSVDCPAMISGLTDANGVVTFHVAGCARNAGGTPESASGASVRADGFLIGGPVRIAALDQNGCDGVNGSDLSLWLADFMSGRAFERSDYDFDGSLGGNDLSLWLATFLTGTSSNGCVSCP